MQNHDHLLLALIGGSSVIAYLIHCQRQHVARKSRRGGN